MNEYDGSVEDLTAIVRGNDFCNIRGQFTVVGRNTNGKPVWINDNKLSALWYSKACDKWLIGHVFNIGSEEHCIKSRPKRSPGEEPHEVTYLPNVDFQTYVEITETPKISKFITMDKIR